MSIDSRGDEASSEGQREARSRDVTKALMPPLTWLPSFCQKTAGCGFPFVSQGNVTVRPWATIWSLGLTTNCGGARIWKERKCKCQPSTTMKKISKRKIWSSVGDSELEQGSMSLLTFMISINTKEKKEHTLKREERSEVISRHTLNTMH